MKYSLISAALVAATTVNARALKRDSPAAALTAQTISGWTSMGCYSDSQKARTLANLVGVGQDIDNTQCQAQCASQGYKYAGNEFGGQCYCDNALNAAAVVELVSDCNATCPADATQPCGGTDRITLFYNGPVQAYNIPGWTSYGCMTDDVSKRALTHQIHADNMTAEVCTSACAALGYTLAGTEWTSECYCDNYIQNNQTLASDQSTCNMPCAGNSAEACGGGGRINVFYVNGSPPTNQVYTSHAISLPAGWSTAGCYSDAVGSRALANYITGPEAGMTVEYCVQGCAAAGWSFAGLENGNECYCGAELDNGQGSVTDGCTSPCSGDNSEVCGGPDRLSLYSAGTASPAQCNNQGLQYAAYANPYTQGDDTYSSFVPTTFKSSNYLWYADVNTDLSGFYNDCSSQNFNVFGSQHSIPCMYHVLNQRGYIYAPVTGTYTLSMSQVDDILLVWTGANALSGWTRENANTWTSYSQGNCDWTSDWAPGCDSYSFQMTAGEYLPIRIMFGQITGAASYELSLFAPDGSDLFNANTFGASPHIVQYSCDGTSAPQFPYAFGSEQ